MARHPSRNSRSPAKERSRKGSKERSSERSRERSKRPALPAQRKRARQWPVSYRDIAVFAALLDFALIVALGAAAAALYHAFLIEAPFPLERSFAVALFAALVFVGLTRLQKLYDPTQLLLWNVQVNNVIWVWCAAFFLLSGWLFMWKSGEVSRGAVMVFWATGLVALIALRAFWRFFLERALEKGSLRGRKVIVIARGRPADRAVMDEGFAQRLVRFGYDLRGEFTVSGASARQREAGLTRAIAFVRGSDIDEILLLVRNEDLPALGPIAETLRILPVPVTWIARGITADLVRHPWFEIGPAVAIEMQKSPRSIPERAVKRLVDVSIAGAGLVLALPLFLGVALAIKLDTPGPVFFWQTRRGFNGKPFRIAKFRSMNVLEDGANIRQATRHDARVTRTGAWLRKTSIDEMPQLFNVLRGEMSLVGPRPHAVAHDDRFIQTVEDYAYRHHVKPGMTGWAQVHGYRGETRTREAIERRVEYDRWYIANWSVWLDVAIMIRTLGELARGRDVY